MLKPALLLVFASIASAGLALAATPSNQQPQSGSADQGKICKMVASNVPHSKPFELCLSQTEWDAKKIADAKDANRIVCHYEDEPGTRLHNRKICMPASDWDARRIGDREQVEQLQMKTCVPGGGC